jgi:hypothetical protein
MMSSLVSVLFEYLDNFTLAGPLPTDAADVASIGFFA